MNYKIITSIITPLVLAASTVQAEQKLPNIIMLYGDDLGYGDLGCYNEDSKIPTPHLNQLASEGMRFTDGHSSSGIAIIMPS